MAEQLEGDRLTKKLIKAGNGEKPPKGSQVHVHYTGKLVDGSTFDSSRTRGKPLSFALGAGQVIAGWDRGVQTMSVGEQAVLTIAPEFGYGSRGIGPIPPDATLIFEVELVGWSETSVVWPMVQKAIIALIGVAIAGYYVVRSGKETTEH
jgi:FKBP-type peptidyl-prolyl cis-trans isomerase